MFCVVLLVFSFVLVGRCQVGPSSPCPETFWYAMLGDTLYGYISVPAQYSDVTLTANFTIKAKLPSEYVGEVEPVGSKNYLGTGYPIIYRVHFPVKSPTPRLTALLVNGQGICYGPGDIPGPGQYVTTISLGHMLYGSGRPSSSFDIPDTLQRPQGGSKIRPETFFNSFNSDKEKVSIITSGPSNKPSQDEFTITIDGDQYVFSPDRFESGGVQTNLIVARPNKEVIKPAWPSKLPVAPAPPSPPLALPPSTFPPQTEAPWSLPPQPEEPWIRPPQPEAPRTRPSQTEAPWIRPPQPEAPRTRPPQTEAPWIRPPQPEAPRTRPPQTEAPWIRPPQTEAPWIRPPQTEAPRTRPPKTQTPQQTLQSQQTLQPQTQLTTTPSPRVVLPTAPATQLPPEKPEGDFECGIVSGGNGNVPLVFGGTDAQRSDWPWLTAIYRRRAGTLSFACGGTLVSPQTVISAAHCIRQRSAETSKRDVVVKVGVYELEAWGDSYEEIRTVQDIQIYPSYNRLTYAMDIMVLILNRAVQYSEFIRPACLWSGDTSLGRVVNSYGTVVGWGKSSELGLAGQGSPKMARIPIVSTETCRASKPQFFGITSEYTLCAGDRNGTGPCNGDSGGGLYLLWNGRWTLRGVVSISLSKDLAGELLCELSEYVVFTDAAKFLDWLRHYIT